MVSQKSCNFAGVFRYEPFKTHAFTMKMNMKQWADELIGRRKVVALPIMTHPGIELNGHTVRQAVSDGRIHYEAVMTLSKRYPACAATTIMDLTTEAEAFGAEVAFSDNAVPAVKGRRLTCAADIDSLMTLQCDVSN